MELSCDLDQRSVHLLGYLFDPDDPALAAETAGSATTGPSALRADGGRGWPSWAPASPGSRSTAIAGDAVVGRPHLARALVDAGADRHRRGAFTDEWIGDGGRAFVDRYAPDLARAIGLVRAAGGVPVLAHPRSPGYEIPDEVIAPGLAGAGLAGIEVYHFDHDQADRAELAALARSLGLIMTGGSDDHGSYQPGRLRRGGAAASAATATPPEQFDRLLALAGRR